MHAIERARQIDRDHAIEVFGRHVGQLETVGAETGVVDKQMHAAQLRFRLSDRCAPGVPVAHVHRQCERFCGRADLRRCSGRGLGLDVRDRDAHACIAASARDGEPDAMSATGDERDATVQRAHGRRPELPRITR
jgi:hypothetical protein